MKIKSILTREEIAKLQTRHAEEIESVLLRRGFDTDDVTLLAKMLDKIIAAAANSDATIRDWITKTNEKNNKHDAKVKEAKDKAKAKRDKKKKDVAAALELMEKYKKQRAAMPGNNAQQSQIGNTQQRG